MSKWSRATSQTSSELAIRSSQSSYFHYRYRNRSYLAVTTAIIINIISATLLLYLSRFIQLAHSARSLYTRTSYQETQPEAHRDRAAETNPSATLLCHRQPEDQSILVCSCWLESSAGDSSDSEVGSIASSIIISTPMIDQ